MNKYLKLTMAILIIVVISTFWYYNNSLNQSKEDAKKIVSRAIVSSKESSITSSVIPQNSLQNKSSKSPEIEPIIESITVETILQTGKFVTLDPLHYAKGSVEAIQKGENVKIVFSQDFATNPDGPDLFVWLIKKQDIKNIAIGGVSAKESDYLNLGQLQNKAGSQVYQITKAEFDQNNYAVVIWCKAFGIQFSNAILK